jgi:hypothetical protein
MNKYFFFILSAALLMGCSRKTTVIKPVQEASILSPSGFIYSLPKTCFEVTLESVLTTITPGPYSRFAEKYLGITSASIEAKSEWSIASIGIKPFYMADLTMLFAVEPQANTHINFVKLMQAGLIIPTQSTCVLENTLKFASPVKQAALLPTDLSPFPFIASEKTTYMSRVLHDSVYVKVPVHKTLVIEKSLEDKAREAADFIFSLRKRRFDLLAGDADFVAEGKAVEAVLAEIRRLEGEYLKLFVGQSHQEHFVSTYNYVPDAENKGSTILFRFSPSKGVLPVADLSGAPVIIATSIDEEWQSLDLFSGLSAEKGKPRSDAFYYRLPVPISIRVSFGQSELVQTQQLAYQFGTLVRMPISFNVP